MWLADYRILRYSPCQLGTSCFMLSAKHFCGQEWVIRVMEALGCVAPPPADLILSLDAVFAPAPLPDPRKSPEAITNV